MGIDPNNRACVFCNSSIETLNHIFVNCRVSINFIDQVNSFICSKLHSDYRDVNKYYFITCNHTDIIINYINMIAKWYLSNCFQYQQLPTWYNFIRRLKKALNGEKPSIVSAITEAVS